MSKAWANVDVLLKQRGDELPKLVATCKQYMAHEQDTLERVIKARGTVQTASAADVIPSQNRTWYGDGQRPTLSWEHGARCR